MDKEALAQAYDKARYDLVNCLVQEALDNANNSLEKLRESKENRKRETTGVTVLFSLFNIRDSLPYMRRDLAPRVLDLLGTVWCLDRSVQVASITIDVLQKILGLLDHSDPAMEFLQTVTSCRQQLEALGECRFKYSWDQEPDPYK